MALAASALTSCGDDIDREGTAAFRRHLEHVQEQRARIAYADTDPVTAGTVSYVLYLSGTSGHFRLDVSMPGFNDGERVDFSIFDSEERKVQCTSAPLFTEGLVDGVCFEDSDPYFAGLAYELGPALWPDAYAEYPVMSTWQGSLLGQETECFEVRISDPHALDDVRADYCFSADSLLMQYDSHWVATEVGPVTAADFELLYPLVPD